MAAVGAVPRYTLIQTVSLICLQTVNNQKSLDQLAVAVRDHKSALHQVSSLQEKVAQLEVEASNAKQKVQVSFKHNIHVARIKYDSYQSFSTSSLSLLKCIIRMTQSWNFHPM